MIKKTVIVKELHGIHARPASQIAVVCRKFESKVTLAKEDKHADGRSVLQMLLLAALQGAQIEVTVEGGDEPAAMNQIVEVFENGGGI